MKKICLALLFYCVITWGSYAQTNPTTTGDQYLAVLFERSFLFDTASYGMKTEEEVEFDIEEAWKGWKTVENYTYGKDRGSLPMIADLKSLHPYFRDQIEELIRVCKAQGIELAIVESFRTHAKQAEYFGMGRKYTRSKGGKSKHQYGLAVDVVPVVDGAAVWENTYLWRKIGLTGERLGLRWGGRWRAPYDPAHFEWTGGMTTTHLSRGGQPLLPKSKAALYPCLEEETALLEKYWEAWEIEQAVTARNGNFKRPSPLASGTKP